MGVMNILEDYNQTRLARARNFSCALAAFMCRHLGSAFRGQGRVVVYLGDGFENFWIDSPLGSAPAQDSADLVGAVDCSSYC